MPLLFYVSLVITRRGSFFKKKKKIHGEIILLTGISGERVGKRDQKRKVVDPLFNFNHCGLSYIGFTYGILCNLIIDDSYADS